MDFKHKRSFSVNILHSDGNNSKRERGKERKSVVPCTVHVTRVMKHIR